MEKNNSEKQAEEKANSKEQREKKNIQEIKAKVFNSKNDKERKKHYTKFILAKERVRVRKQQISDKEQKAEGNDEGNGNRTT